MVVGWVCGNLLGTPSSAGSIHWAFLLSVSNKKVLVPRREQGQKKQFLRYHLVCRKSDRSSRRQHAVCPVTLAMRQKILWYTPFPSALGGPFAAPLFALLSAMQNSLWMRLAALLPLRWFQLMLRHLYTIRVCLSRTFFHRERTIFQYSRTTPLTMPMISALVPSMGL